MKYWEFNGEELTISINAPVVYICPKHGEAIDYMTSSFDGLSDKYCQICYMELIRNNCCRLQEKKLNEAEFKKMYMQEPAPPSSEELARVADLYGFRKQLADEKNESYSAAITDYLRANK
jgi:hypothetical protein